MVSASTIDALKSVSPASAETLTLAGVSEGGTREGGEATDFDDEASGSKKYHVLMELGRGGTGIVRAAIARGIGGFSKLVVLKTTKPELDGQETVKLLLNEARLSSRMNHPNIVQVYEVYQDAGGVPVIVMEYLDGQSLAKLLTLGLRDRAYTTEIGLSIMCKVLEALAYAHTLTDFSGRPLGIVHRDVTPQNVMITYDGQVKLLDFGIAKLNLQSNANDTGSVKGKLGYMSPEQLSGLRLDARADVFAVGVMIWEVVARRRMWATFSDADIMRQLLQENIPSLRAAVPDVDPELERICSKALSPRAEDRYESAKALLGDLQGFLAAGAGAASPEAIVELMNRTCTDLRASVQGRLELELAKFARCTDENWGVDDVERTLDAFTAGDRRSSLEAARNTIPATPLGRKGETGSSRAVELPELDRAAAPRPRRWLAWWAAAAFAVVAGSGWGLAVQQRWVGEKAPAATVPAAAGAPGPAAVRSSVASNASVAEPAPHAEVSVSLSVEPAGARLLLDGERLANPYRGSRPRDAELHELRAEADGYVPIVRRLRFDADLHVTLAMQAAPAAQRPAAMSKAGGSPSRSGGQKAARRETQAPRAEPRALTNCDPPYYFDEHGIKHYLRECLGQ